MQSQVFHSEYINYVQVLMYRHDLVIVHKCLFIKLFQHPVIHKNGWLFSIRSCFSTLWSELILCLLVIQFNPFIYSRNCENNPEIQFSLSKTNLFSLIKLLRVYCLSELRSRRLLMVVPSYYTCMVRGVIRSRRATYTSYYYLKFLISISVNFVFTV